MNVVTLPKESTRQGGFYVPQFEVRIAGANLPRDVLRDVIQLTYKDNIKEIDSFELTVNNWDPTTRSYKYVGAEDERSLTQNPLHRLFDPCHKQVEIRMGYLGELRVMMRGSFTTLEPNFPSGGGPTLTVRGLNVLHQLRSKQFTSTWTDKKDSEIAEEIARLTDPATRRKRFPLPVETDPKAKKREQRIPFVAQKNQYDIDFLLTRARERGYVIVVLEEDDHPKRPGLRRPRRLYFGPSQAGMTAGLRDVTFELRMGMSLIDFKPTLTTANQIKSVTVNGWNRATRQPISETVTLEDRQLNLNRNLHEILNKCDPREERVVDEPVFTRGQARDRAIALLTERQKDMVKATATTVGLPDLRAGQWVRIEGLGVRFSGTYFITDTTHTINDSGYTTRLNARREEPEGAGSGPQEGNP